MKSSSSLLSLIRSKPFAVLVAAVVVTVVANFMTVVMLVLRRFLCARAGGHCMSSLRSLGSGFLSTDFKCVWSAEPLT